MDKVKAEMIKANIESALETVNLTLKTPLEYSDFEKYLALGWDGPRIVREINERAAQIRQAEKAAEEMATKKIEEEKAKGRSTNTYGFKAKGSQKFLRKLKKMNQSSL